MERASAAASPRPGANLTASCRLQWLSGSPADGAATKEGGD
jgi:hypothetical protein